VYQATDTRSGRKVAIKVLASHLSSSPELKQRMEREARAISSLNHPHICHLYDIASQGGTDEGETLAEPLRKGALPLNEVFKVGIAVAEARPLSARPQHRICPPPLRCGRTDRGQRGSGRNPRLGVAGTRPF
jgi:serine/threonine protein kinase